MNVFEASFSYRLGLFRHESRALEAYSRHYPRSFATANIFHVEPPARCTYVHFSRTHYRLRHRSTKPFSQLYTIRAHPRSQPSMNRMYPGTIDCCWASFCSSHVVFLNISSSCNRILLIYLSMKYESNLLYQRNITWESRATLFSTGTFLRVVNTLLANYRGKFQFEKYET